MRHTVAARLEGNEWLNALPSEARADIIKSIKARQVLAAQPVHAKGQAAEGLFTLLSGEVRVSSTTFSGEEIVFTRLRPGSWFGEIAILDGGTRTHDAHAIVDSELAIVPKSAILASCHKYPEVYRALVALLCQHCRQAFSALDEFLVYSPEQRLARRLLNLLAEQHHRDILISQQELGSLVGISRQSTNKILKRWENQGCIKRIYGGVHILDTDSIRQLCE